MKVLCLLHHLSKLEKSGDDGELSFNPFPNKPCFLRVCSTSLLKTLREKEKLLVTSNFSFSHSVFYLFGELSAIFNKLEIVVCKLFQFGRVQNFLFGKGLTQQNFYWADDEFSVAKTRISVISVGNIDGKGENAGFQHFLLFTQRFSKGLFSGMSKVLTVW